MAKYLKPSVNKVWAASGLTATPTDTKIASGWLVEKPPVQTFNWLDNRQDTMLAYLNQQGIPEWDAVTEYQAASSFVQGSNGLVYKAKTTNTNEDPTLDTTEADWEVAFAQRVAAPATAASAGVKGVYAFDSSFLYICVAANTWLRIAIATWV